MLASSMRFIRQPPPSNPGAHISSIAQYHDMYHKSIADPKATLSTSAICHRELQANPIQAFWSELALRDFAFKFEGDAHTFKHVMRYNFNM